MSDVRRFRVAMLLLFAEISVSAATSYAHHSEAVDWIGPAYFPSPSLYLQVRLFHWIIVTSVLLALAAVVGRTRFRRGEILLTAALGLPCEIIVTLISAAFPNPAFHINLIFDSFPLYLFSRLGVWLPLLGAELLIHCKLADPHPAAPSDS